MTRLLSAFFLFFLSFSISAQQGLQGEYFDGKEFNQRIATRTDAALDFYWPEFKPPFVGLSPEAYSIKWTGYIIAPESGVFTFSAIVDDGLKVTIGGVLVIDSWQLNDNADYSGKVKLKAGNKYPIQVEYFNGLLEGEIHLYWEKPSFEQSFWERLTSEVKGEKVPHTSFLLPKRTPAPKAKPKQEPIVKKDSPKEKKVKPKPKAQEKPVITSEPILTANNDKQIADKQKAIDTLQVFLPKKIFFKRSKPIILPNSFTDLDILAERLVHNPTIKLKIAGHTDNVGDAKLNMELSKKRARTVARYLVKKGVNPTRIIAMGYGGTKPIASNESEEGRSKNRRVDFELY